MALSGLTDSEKEDMIVSLACVLLHDAGIVITGSNINKVVEASGNSVESYWGSMFASLLAGRNFDDLIMKPGAGGSVAVGGGGVGGAGPVAEEAPAEEKKEESESEASAGGAGGLFDDDDEW